MNRSFWKASEWKWWLLHYAIPCLERHTSKEVPGQLSPSQRRLPPSEGFCGASDVAQASDQLADFVVILSCCTARVP